MNMPRRPDEDRLWSAFGPGAEHRTVRDARAALGIDERRAYYLCTKWSRQGRYDWGTSFDLGWKCSEDGMPQVVPPPVDADAWLKVAVDKMVEQERMRLEQLVVQSLMMEIPVGIAIIEHQPEFESDERTNTYSMTQTTEMRLDKNVPAMNIYRYPSHEAYLEWLERKDAE